MRSESEVGILCRIIDGTGAETRAEITRFRGLLKQRFSDFHVHEIDDVGQRVNLNTFKLPNEEEETKVPSLDNKSMDDETLLEWISNALRDEICNLQQLDNSATGRNAKLEINVTSADKSIRTKIHRWLDNFDKLGSETIDRDGQKYIQIYRELRKGKDRRHIRPRRPHNRAKFTHCVLYKEGIDTSDAINYLCRKLRIHPRHITFAGTKDKQAKTVQRICFSNMEAKRLLELNKYSTHSKLGNFSYQDSPLHLGQLRGNHFTILIRNVQAHSPLVIPTAIESLSSNGFINYFGLQRFGSFRISTHLVGKSILQMEWLKAFDLILEPNDIRDRGYMKKAKKLWLEKRDPIGAWKEIPQHHLSIEASLLQGLSRFYATGDHWSAFASLPRTMRTLYFHSFQSYLWNHLATYRIQQHGLRPVIGDLVLLDSDSEPLLNDDICDDVIVEAELEGRSNSREIPAKVDAKAASAPKVKILTHEDFLPNYTIFDVIIPIEGTEIKIPEGSNLKSYWNKLLTENGIEEGFPNFRPRSELPKGSLRKVVVQPKNVTHQVIPYNEKENLDTFIPSDYDLILQKEKVQVSTANADNSLCSDVISNLSDAVNEKDKTCVILQFSLPSSSYATMALREILEIEQVEDTSALPSLDEEGAGGNPSSIDKRKLDANESGATPGENGGVGIAMKKFKDDVLGDELAKTSSNTAGES